MWRTMGAGRGGKTRADHLDSEWAASYEAELTRAAFASERRRMALVAGVLGVAMCMFIIVLSIPGFMPAWARERFIPRAPYIIALYAAVCIYELGARRWVGRLMREGRTPPGWARFFNAALEVSLPTALITVAARVFTPADALAAPPAFFYPILIMLMTLQLDGRICVFAGFVAGTEYLILALHVLPARDTVGAAALATTTMITADPMPHVLRGGVIVVFGFAAAFVARQLRGQFEDSARAVAQREHAVGVFGQHVSPQVAERLLGRRARDGAAPEVREVCVMFLDIRDFTAFADRRSPEEVMDYLNRLFAPMIETINRHGGIINKFLGDGFMAVFGAPAEDGQAARHAVHAARELVDQVHAASGGLPDTRIGIGLHAGPAVTGDVGSAGRKEYTVIGGVVNLASRMEQLNKQFGTRVLASAAVVAALTEQEAAQAHPLGEVPVRGQLEPVTVYQLA